MASRRWLVISGRTSELPVPCGDLRAITGERLHYWVFGGSAPQRRGPDLELLDTQRFASGAAYLKYRPKQA